MKTKLSITEYIALRGCSRQNALKTLADKRSLLGVSKSQKIGNMWVLTVDERKVEKINKQAGKDFHDNSEK